MSKIIEEGGLMAYKNKAYVCFDGDEDIQHYRLLKAWDAHDNIDFSFFDAHDLMQARDSSNEESIKRSLRARLNNTREFIVLVGDKTKFLYRFVRWEIEVAISMGLPIIVVNLNGKKSMDKDLCPPILRDTLAIHIPFELKAIRYALKNWPSSAVKHKRDGKTGAFYYTDETYAGMSA